MNMLTRGRVAMMAGVGSETLRFYESKGLIESPARAVNGYRMYDPGVIKRIRFIRRAKELGFSLSEIKELLELRVDSTRKCRDVYERAQRKVAEVEAKIRDLHTISNLLRSLASRCSVERPVQECSFLESLEADKFLVSGEPDHG